MRTLFLSLAAAGLLATAGAGAAGAPTVVARITLAPFTRPCAAAGGAGAVWVSEYASPYLLKINPKTNRVVARTRIGSGSCGLDFGAGSLWVEDTSSSTLSRVSARTAERIEAIPVGGLPYDATFEFGSAWVTSHTGDLERVDPARNRVVRRWPLEDAIGVVGAFGSIWATGLQGVIRVDPVTNAVVARIPLAGGAGWTAASDDAVWVTTPAGLARIDPQTSTVVTTVPLPQSPAGDPAVVGGEIWVPLVRQNRVAVVDPATDTVVRWIKAGTGPFVVTEIGGDAWIPSWRGNEIWRVRP